MPLFLRPLSPLSAILLGLLCSLLVLATTSNASSWSPPGSKFTWSGGPQANCTGSAARHESVFFHTTPHCERDSPSSSYMSQCTMNGGHIRTRYPSSPNCKGWWMKEFSATNRCFIDSLPTVQLCPGDTDAENFLPLKVLQPLPDARHPLVGGSSFCGEGGKGIGPSHDDSRVIPCRGPRMLLYDDSSSCEGLSQTLVLFEGLSHGVCSFDTTSGSFIKTSCDDYRSLMRMAHFNGHREDACDDPNGPYKYIETSYGACRTISSRRSVLYLCE